MGNSCKIIYINDPLHYFFSNIRVSNGNINLIDLFPMLRSRIATINTINNLISILPKYSDNVVPTLYYKAIEMLNITDDVIHKVKQEEIVSEQLKRVLYYFGTNISNGGYTCIYDFAYFAGRICNNKEIITVLADHPLINPLTISMVSGNNFLINKYLYTKDSRIDIMRTYRFLIQKKDKKFLEYRAILEHIIITKNILIKRVFNSISLDVCRYVIQILLKK